MIYDIGFIGFGEANQCLLDGILKNNMPTVTVYDVRREKVEQIWNNRHPEYAVKFADSLEELLAETAVLFCALPAQQMSDLIDCIKPFVSSEHLFVDFSTAEPTQKKEFNDILITQGTAYTDVAMMGSLPMMLNKVPMLYCGSGAAEFEKISSKYGFDARTVEGQAGNASLIKLCRSVFMKGLAGLLIETKQISDNYGVTEDVLGSICKSMDQVSFDKHIDRLIGGTCKHIDRRSHEISTAYNFFENDGLACDITKAVVTQYRKLNNKF